MKEIIQFSAFMILLVNQNLFGQIDQYYNYVRPGTKTVSPVTVFDASSANSSLEAGAATINGIVLLKSNKRSKTYIKQEVYLFPATEYFDEFLKLKKKNKRKKVVVDNKFLAAKKTSMINDENGSFSFSNVKPGKYYLYTELHTLGSENIRHKVGNQQWGVYNGMGTRIGGYSTPVYGDKMWMTSKLHILSKEISVTDQNQTITVEL